MFIGRASSSPPSSRSQQRKHRRTAAAGTGDRAGNPHPSPRGCMDEVRAARRPAVNALSVSRARVPSGGGRVAVHRQYARSNSHQEGFRRSTDARTAAAATAVAGGRALTSDATSPLHRSPLLVTGTSDTSPLV